MELMFNMGEHNRKSLRTKLLVGLLLAICGFGILAVIIIPNLIKARPIHNAQPCLNNLREIEAAANQFAIVHHKVVGDPINFPDDLTPFMRLNSDGKIPSCPWGGVYSMKRVGDTPTCSLGKTNTDGYLHTLL
jgi:competence protein ComGC